MMRCSKIILLLVIFLYQSAILSFGQLRLPRLISDGMVLQRDAAIKIWGWGRSNERVTVAFRKASYTTTVDATGLWSVVVQNGPAGGPFTMEIKSDVTITLRDILAGDVWVCSGQSNMVLPMERVKERYPKIIAEANDSAIRQFLVPLAYDFSNPHHDLISGSWEMVNPKSILRFSATGYFFARTLKDKIHVPIGLINASVGGSPVEAWLSAEALEAFPDQKIITSRFKNGAFVDSIKKAEAVRTGNWYSGISRNDLGYRSSPVWYDSSYNSTGWQVTGIPGYREDAPGVVWFAKEFGLPPTMTNQPAKLFLGRIIDSDSVYVNGVFIGATAYQYPPRRYDVAHGILKKGKNILVVRVINNNGRGGFAPGKEYSLTSGTMRVDLTGDWRYRKGATSDPLPASTFFQYLPGGLFNGEIAPLLPYTIKGVVWYQGESNASRAATYSSLFGSMVNDWRKHWHQDDFPFLFVQLPNYQTASPSKEEWAQLREAQSKVLALPNTAMAVAIDIGEWNDLHPTNKQDIGKRLAYAAEHVVYRDTSVIYRGPVYTSVKIRGHEAILSFRNAGSGIDRRYDRLNNFSIAAKDRVFVPASARIEGDKIIVWSDTITDPVAVRYAWSDNPVDVNFFNREGLPAAPFRTDNWK